MAGIDIDEDRFCARLPDGEGGGDERVSRQDDLVSGADSEYAQGELQGIETIADSDAMLRLTEFRELSFKGGNVFAEDKIPTAHDRGYGRVHLGFERPILLTQIDKRYFCSRHEGGLWRATRKTR